MAAPRHGLSVFGTLKYSENFQHFDYVNPDAPKGGKMSLIGPVPRETFDSFNGYILRGDPVQGFELMFDSLMARAMDEPDAVYGLVARSADVADDRMSVTFALRPEAAFADGTPLTADDVCDSFRLLSTEGNERIKITIRDVTSCDILGPHEVRYRFHGKKTRDLPLTIAELPIFSKAYYSKVDFAKSTLEPPLGSGPYKVRDFKPGQYVAYVRRTDYWARNLPVNAGRFNFDEVRFEYFRERTAGLEALKTGILDLREEYTSRDWATAYDFPARRDGRVIQEVLPDETPSGAQGFFFNLRRDKFHDVRVRKALNLAFDFEWSNANLFYGLYRRTESFFELSPLKAEGPPSDAELVLLSPYRDTISPEVFDIPEPQPVSDGSGQDRKLLRRASQLLDDAGWTTEGSERRNSRGETLSIEFLIDSPVFERIIAPYVKNLRLLGIDAAIRSVDEAQYQSRIKSFDYDIVSSRFATGLTPGDSLRIFFGSASANAPGSYNMSGIASPELDALIDHIVGAENREDLEVAGRALDRVLRAAHFWVPNWHKGSHWIAYWDKFGRPSTKPKYDRGIVDTWWYDEVKAARIAQGN
ncbi:MAG: ABC transporter substrate-binding protein [Alphaproteobacteria bacterium]|nr:ABC transporter substrate-binding protein [Alphaproteobacteria bacterium]